MCVDADVSLQLIVVMASHCYLSGQTAETFIEFLVQRCAISDEEAKKIKAFNKVLQKSNSFQNIRFKKLEVIGFIVITLVLLSFHLWCHFFVLYFSGEVRPYLSRRIKRSM